MQPFPVPQTTSERSYIPSASKLTRENCCASPSTFTSRRFSKKGRKVLNSQNPSRLETQNRSNFSMLSYPCYSLPATSVHTLGGRKQDLAMLFGGEHGHKTDIQLGVSHPPHLTSKTVTATAKGEPLPTSNVLDISQKEEREALLRGGGTQSFSSRTGASICTNLTL